jgi:hypothetical protein
MIITKEFLKDIKKANSICIRFIGEYSTIDLFYRVDTGIYRRISYDYGNSFKLRGNWHIFLWPGQLTNTGSIISLLRAGDEIRFEAEYNGNQYLEEAGINNHQLILTVIRKNERLEFVFDSQNCPTNSALNLTSGIKILPVKIAKAS